MASNFYVCGACKAISSKYREIYQAIHAISGDGYSLVARNKFERHVETTPIPLEVLQRVSWLREVPHARGLTHLMVDDDL